MTDRQPAIESSRDDDDDDSSPLSLRPEIFFPGVSCLNEAVRGSGASILKVPDEQFTSHPSLRSPEDDAELLLRVPFMETVAIHSILVGRNPEASAPRVVKVFVDRDDIDFEMARELEPKALIELPPCSSQKGSSTDGSVVDVHVFPGRFHDASSVTLFFAGNQSGNAQSSTEVTYVGFAGTNTHMKRLPVTYAVHESQARLEDHEVHAEGIGAAEGHGF
eukprot:CAMPEP_0119013580 /NCGR_PEP_ID=MMETSP1176-20130426/8528_1 /TAXON_ID=265551 /ORGANISM="Synedropsis recta cf, Strain CCMP1620" /LENGTH=219 /DNA_ID=CAMNT_0006966681 /DNA_START=110 /DNA_END=769 /DNA_ORIENTATION=-